MFNNRIINLCTKCSAGTFTLAVQIFCKNSKHWTLTDSQGQFFKVFSWTRPQRSRPWLPRSRLWLLTSKVQAFTLVTRSELISFRICITIEVTVYSTKSDWILASSFKCSSFVVISNCDFDSSTDFIAACVSLISLEKQTKLNIWNSYGTIKFSAQINQRANNKITWRFYTTSTSLVYKMSLIKV